jgi:hypothetical protein
VQVPLTEARIKELLLDALGYIVHDDDHMEVGILITRAVEAAHGISKAPRPSAPTGQINPDSADSVAQWKEADHG